MCCMHPDSEIVQFTWYIREQEQSKDELSAWIQGIWVQISL